MINVVGVRSYNFIQHKKRYVVCLLESNSIPIDRKSIHYNVYYVECIINKRIIILRCAVMPINKKCKGN